MDSDINIARKANSLPILEIAKNLKIPEESIIPYGNNKAKIDYGFIKSLSNKENGKLEGKWVSFDKNGNELVVGFYKNGKKEGKWSFKNKNSVHQVNFKNNKIISNF